MKDLSSSRTSLFEVKEVSKKFGYRKILNSASLELASGECVLLEGENGVGKSTLLRILAGTLRPNHFEKICFHDDPLYNSVRYRSRMAYLSHIPMVYADLSAAENLRFSMRISQNKSSDSIISALLKRADLDKRADDPVRTFSRGMLQRLSICRALIIEPDLFLLDEPFSGLDKKNIQMLLEVIQEQLSLNKTFLITTHDPQLLSGLSNRELVLAQGKLHGK